MTSHTYKRFLIAVLEQFRVRAQPPSPSRTARFGDTEAEARQPSPEVTYLNYGDDMSVSTADTPNHLLYCTPPKAQHPQRPILQQQLNTPRGTLGVAYLLVVDEGLRHARSLGDGHEARSSRVGVVDVHIQSSEHNNSNNKNNDNGTNGSIGVEMDYFRLGYVSAVRTL